MRQALKELKDWFEWLLWLKYEPDKWAHPALKGAVSQVAQAGKKGDTGFRLRFVEQVGQEPVAVFGRDEEVAPGIIETEYRRGGEALSDDRAITLTPEDLRNLRNLDRRKAEVIKPLWAAKLPASKASATLTTEHGRGYGQRTVEDFYAAFNAAFYHSPTTDRGD